MPYKVTIHEVALYYQASHLIGVDPADLVTADTYLYRNTDGEIVIMQKRDRTAIPSDEAQCIGYARPLGIGIYARGTWA